MFIDPRICRPALEQGLGELRPRSLLTLGEGMDAALAPWLEGRPEIRHRHLDADALDGALTGLGMFDVALGANLVERLAPARAGRLIAALRDLHSRRLYLLVPVGADWPGLASHWRAGDLIAYGLSEVERYRVGGRAVHLYRHDLYDYKHTPDWLNPRHWAHPELWDKYRW